MSPSKERNLTMQGFSCSVESGISSIDKWLRFTPTLSAIWILMGTLLINPVILWLFSIVSAIGSISDRHVFDLFYNRWVRKFTKTQELPTNPRPRRFAMFLAAIWSALTGWFFLSGFAAAGLASGLLLTGAGTLVATTHFCLGSLIYRKWERFKTRAV